MIKKRMLIAYSASSTHVQTTLDYLQMLQRHVGYEADFVHVTHDAIIDFDINDYDVVFNSYCARHCYEGYVSASFEAALKTFGGLKAMAVQDEYDRTNTLKAAIKNLGFHVVFTCVPQSSLEYVYPRSEFPDVEFVTVFTGYVPDWLIERSRAVRALIDRPIVVGYRGRDIGGRYGRLGFEKYEIGSRMKEVCDSRRIPNDIAMDENSRIYGKAWFDFIESCRAMLGSESGSNIFDFDGSIEQTYHKLAAQNGGRVPTYEEFLPYVADREKEIQMGQISPRIFECAALRTAMVLYRGRYSDAIEPNKHYIALEKDFSNIDEVLAKLNDIPALTAIIENAYEELIGSAKYTYAAFGRRVAAEFDRQFERLNLDRQREYRAKNSISCLTPQSPKERILAERPTKVPQTLEVFNEKMDRINGLVYAAELARIDVVYMDTLDQRRSYLSTTFRPIVNSSDGVFTPAIQSVWADFDAVRDERQRYLNKRHALIAEADTLRSDNREAEAGRLEALTANLDRDWLDRYQKLYVTAYKNYEQTLNAITGSLTGVHISRTIKKLGIVETTRLLFFLALPRIKSRARLILGPPWRLLRQILR